MCRNIIEERLAVRDGKPKHQLFSLYSWHTSFNITLFPALFFFSALYYTDVVSALLVLVAYRDHLKRLSAKEVSLSGDLWTVCLGIVTLLMRQTNVFWVVVYLGGMESVAAIQALKPAAVEVPRFNNILELVEFYAGRYSVGDIHDPPLNMAWLDGKSPPF